MTYTTLHKTVVAGLAALSLGAMACGGTMPKKDNDTATTTPTARTSQEPKPATAAPKPAFDMAAAGKLVKQKCSECHELKELDSKKGSDRAGWTAVVNDMVNENAADISEADQKTIIEWLVRSYGPKSKTQG